MGTISKRWGARLVAVTGAAVAATIVLAPSASAHECFKKQWSDAAYQQQLTQPHYAALDALIDMYVISEAAPDCLGKVDVTAALQPWMSAEGISHVPLIYMNPNIPENAYKAWMNDHGNSGPGLIGPGPAKETKAIGYLENHFDKFMPLVMGALEQAAADGKCTLPAQP